ncbi:MAG: transcription termination factor Rho [Planctomycetes bacterium]|nr:transcription termination factor Rho [Planctomycetota bacterium]
MSQRTGVIDLSQTTDGRLRLLDKTLVERAEDPLIPTRLIDQYGLRTGLTVSCIVGAKRGPEPNGKKKKKKKSRLAKELGAAPRVEQILEIDHIPVDQYKGFPALETRTSIDPQPRLTLEYPGCPPACRLIDLFCPIGYGQRGLIVSPPKAGKTTLLQQIAFAIQKNHPNVIVYALLIDERPEEVTDFRRNVPCDVLASSNDHPPERHVGLAIMGIERAKRLAEEGKHVVILLDSLTRVGRAFNTAPGIAQTGRTLSGGIDASALSIPKQLFGAARNTEEAGSLTILATCLVDTGSRGDQLIFEEFKGTGNMEMILDRDIANHRVFPAINLAASGTRKEHLLIDQPTLDTTTALRRRLLTMPPLQQVEQLLKALEHYKTNDELVGKNQPASAR